MRGASGSARPSSDELWRELVAAIPVLKGAWFHRVDVLRVSLRPGVDPSVGTDPILDELNRLLDECERTRSFPAEDPYPLLGALIEVDRDPRRWVLGREEYVVCTDQSTSGSVQAHLDSGELAIELHSLGTRASYRSSDRSLCYHDTSGPELFDLRMLFPGLSVQLDGWPDLRRHGDWRVVEPSGRAGTALLRETEEGDFVTLAFEARDDGGFSPLGLLSLAAGSVFTLIDYRWLAVRDQAKDDSRPSDAEILRIRFRRSGFACVDRIRLHGLRPASPQDFRILPWSHLRASNRASGRSGRHGIEPLARGITEPFETEEDPETVLVRLGLGSGEDLGASRGGARITLLGVGSGLVALAGALNCARRLRGRREQDDEGER